MLMIKPYGRSVTQDSATHGEINPDRRRQLQRKPNELPNDVHRLMQDPAFLMAQWISCIDKIIIKPKPRKSASLLQRKTRQLIGDAGWRLLCLDPVHIDHWQWKLHPYTCETGASNSKIDIKGRWYNRMVGAVEPTEINADLANAIANKIRDHLVHAAQTQKGSARHPRGQMEHLLTSIEKNVHRPRFEKTPLFTEADWCDYFQKNDVVASIYRDVQARAKCRKIDLPPIETGGMASQKTTPGKIQPVRVVVARQLFSHFATVFGPQTKVKELMLSTHPLHRLWLVHAAIKDCYKALMDNASIKRQLHIHEHIPSKQSAMLTLLNQRRQNQSVSHLIRLGKVIFYEAAQMNQSIVEDWPSVLHRVERSTYWLSKGQAEIKRSESLVRSFKQIITHAAYTITDLTQWPIDRPEIFEHWKNAASQAPVQHLQAGLKRLYGVVESESFFPSAFGKDGVLSEDMKCLIQDSIYAWRCLRNSCFHFSGKRHFLNKLRQGLMSNVTCPAEGENGTAESVLRSVEQALWARDVLARQQRLIGTLKSAHCEDYLNQAQLDHVYQCINGTSGIPFGAKLDLPRLNRVLTRAQSINLHQISSTGVTIRLPPPAKREELMASSALHCRYVLLKHLYATDFSVWLDKRGAREIGKWIQQAVKRTTEAARELNPIHGQQVHPIQAKAAKLANQASANDLKGPDTLRQFLDQLTAETASEFRVQKFYESDAEKAKQQAAYIDDLKCDVLAIGWLKYLDVADRRFLLSELIIQNNQSQLDSTCLHLKPTSSETIHDWQIRLYFLLHMVPVGSVSQLLHQLRKWHVLSQPDDAAEADELFLACAKVMVLYLDMHDAKFDGGTPMNLGAEDVGKLNVFFGDQVVRDACLPQHSITSQSLYIPLRGLREMLRFGSAEVLQPILKKAAIQVEELSNWEALQGQIQAAQERREALHAQWVAAPKAFSQVQRDEYQAALAVCSQYRQLAHRIRLVDPLNLHTIMLAVLSRLADFAGIWERDLCFYTLALCHQNGIDPRQAFPGDAGKHFAEGQIVRAIDKCARIKCLVKPLHDKARRDLRNRLSHFNMLRKESGHTDLQPICLTNEVNNARKLMSYDRKLKNAVAKSIMELLDREGFSLRWTMAVQNDLHLLRGATVETHRIAHFYNSKPTTTEPRHSAAMCRMIQQLFDFDNELKKK